MKRCDNCFEVNSDGATNCVICGEPMDVPQLEADDVTMSVASSPPTAEYAAPLGATDAGQTTEVIESPEEAVAAEPEVENEPAAILEADETAADELEDEQELPLTPESDEIAADELEDESELAAPRGPDEIAAAGVEDGPEPSATPEPDQVAATEPDDIVPAELEDEPEPAAAVVEPEQVPATGPREASVDPDATPPASPVPTDMPVNGQAVLQVFHNTEPRVVHSHPVVNDVTLIGREDPQRDVFPDLDLGKLVDQGVSVTRVSRQHLRLLRQGTRYFLFVYRGSTGTQVNKELVDESRYGKRFEIQIGDRIILGGQVRMKLAAGM